MLMVATVQEMPVRYPPKTFIVDLMYQPGRLMSTDSTEAVTYCQPWLLFTSCLVLYCWLFASYLISTHNSLLFHLCIPYFLGICKGCNW